MAERGSQMQAHSNRLPSNAVEVLLGRRAKFISSVRRRVRCLADAEDIVQDAFLRCFEHRSAFREDRDALPWFRGILANTTVDHFRRRAAFARALQALAVEPRDPGDTQDLRTGEAGQRASAILEGLRPEYRQALQAVYLEARPLPELARQAGITVNNAAVRVFRARKAVRKLTGSGADRFAEATA
jgi:RNA polymerase sigma-70 factor, ECF subfamily